MRGLIRRSRGEEGPEADQSNDGEKHGECNAQWPPTEGRALAPFRSKIRHVGPVASELDSVIGFHRFLPHRIVLRSTASDSSYLSAYRQGQERSAGRLLGGEIDTCKLKNQGERRLARLIAVVETRLELSPHTAGNSTAIRQAFQLLSNPTLRTVRRKSLPRRFSGCVAAGRGTIADTQRPVTIWEMAAPLAPTNPTMVTWADMPVLYPTNPD